MNKKELNQKIKAFFKEKTLEKLSKQQLETKKAEFCKKYNLDKYLLTSEIANVLKLKNTPEHLQTKPSRTQSGVVVVAIMSKPLECPGNCIYCPNYKNVPRSYVGFEPASMRAKRNDYDPYKQIVNRLKQLKDTGHPTNKIELIIMGGTFPATPIKYQKEFMVGVYQAITNSKETNLEKLKKKAMTSKRRLIGITFETRPDYCNKEIIKQLLDYGGTRIEMGVQILDDKVLKFVNRGHGVKEVVDTTKLLKDAGFKVLYHIMPGLPTSNYKNDLKCFKKVFEDSRFKPDMLKIYPCLVTGNTKLEQMYYSGEYVPYDDEKAIKLLADFKETVPEWVRIMRIQRDIPVTKIIAGLNKGNLRELVKKELEKRNKKCRCIRCREPKNKIINEKNIKIKQIKYEASQGTEYFIAAEDNDCLLGFIRLRIPNNPFIENITKKTTIVRELHVYGKTTDFDKKNIQHTGIGKKLLKEAEEITTKNNFEKISIISGIGVREYYKKQGYFLDEPYMSKLLKR
jgi:elongator complex protein 3